MVPRAPSGTNFRCAMVPFSTQRPASRSSVRDAVESSPRGCRVNATEFLNTLKQPQHLVEIPQSRKYSMCSKPQRLVEILYTSRAESIRCAPPKKSVKIFQKIQTNWFWGISVGESFRRVWGRTSPRETQPTGCLRDSTGWLRRGGGMGG